MGIVRRTATSRRDYQAIWDYVAQHGSPGAADALLLAFDDRVAFISDNAGAGTARPEFRPGLRSFPVGRYLLFYRPVQNGIELVRVIHGARDLRRLFRH